MLSFRRLLIEGKLKFKATYRVYDVSKLPANIREDFENGGKIIMPSSALRKMTVLRAKYPLLFKLTNKVKKRSSHAGVLEFIAEEGVCYLPKWLMKNLNLNNGDQLCVQNVSLDTAIYSKFQPRSPDFLDITNPKAVLENALRNFSCLTTGDVIAIQYNKKAYEFNVLDTKPDNAVNILECDMNVEFVTPVGYKEPSSQADNDESKDDKGASKEEISSVFEGQGQRVDGKPLKKEQNVAAAKKPVQRGIPDFDFRIGTLTFDRSVIPISDRPKPAKKPKDKGKDIWFGTAYTCKQEPNNDAGKSDQ